MKRDWVVWTGCVALFFSGGIFFYLIPNGTLLIDVLNRNPAMAAWVQAVGSIMALFVAIFISYLQNAFARNQKLLEAQSKRQSCLAVVEFAVQQGVAVSSYLEEHRYLPTFVSMWNSRFSSVSKFSLDSLGAISVHELGGREAVLAYSDIFGNLAKIRDASIAIVVGMNKGVRDFSSHQELIHNAAGQLKADILNFKMHYKLNCF